MSRIKHIQARQILDSRGLPTVEVDVHSDCGAWGRAAVPSGASTGSHEALELRDLSPPFLGKGVTQALRHIHTQIAPALIGMDLSAQKEIDAKMCEIDGTENKSKLGANAILGVSLSVAQAAAAAAQQPLFRHMGAAQATGLPVPMINVLNGGKHADNAIDFQEFMIMPAGAPTFSEALRVGVEIFQHLRKVLRNQGLATNVGDEGGFAPALSSNEAAMDMLIEAIHAAGYTPGQDVLLCLDPASTEYYHTQEKCYRIGKKSYDTEAMLNFWEDWLSRYPIFSIEDAMAEDDWAGWQALTERIGHKVQLVGDDLFVTNLKRLTQGIEKDIANAILIKPNQVGTLSETLEVIALAQKQGYPTIISHRSGETEDHTLADLAVGTRAEQIKTGSVSRSDRLAKYNQLLRIEEQLQEQAQFAGPKIMHIFQQQSHKNTQKEHT